VHNHQPVGNFGYVFEQAYRSAYLPFLELVERHPDIRIVFHTSGPLWDWIGEHEPQYIERLAALVARGQVEMLTGGYYEPILPAIPRADAVGQIRKLTAFLRTRLHATAQGAWLAERVWEPSLPAVLHEAGVRYVAVDDSHFRRAGLLDQRLGPYYFTEDQGAVVAVFPIDKELRYRIPYDSPEGALEYLTSAPPGSTQVLADDGEKFGVWPGTHKLVYEERWLERFFTLLGNARDRVQTATFTEVLADTPPAGLVYLPTASYAEMMEWALPVPAQERFVALHARLEAANDPYRDAELLGGGFWRMFLARYPEANRMHKRVQAIRARWDTLAAHPELFDEASTADAHAAALEEIWKAECNCPYWHGVFGGLYLPHIRGAIYSHAVRANALLDRIESPEGVPRARLEDVDLDGRIEAVLATGSATAIVDGYGTVVSYEIYEPSVNLADVLARRREVYHSKVHEAVPRTGEAKTIHGTYTAKEAGLERLLVYDDGPRGLFTDRLLAAADDVGAAVEATAATAPDRASPTPPVVAADQSDASVTLVEEIRAAACGLRVTKRVRLGREAAALSAHYAIERAPSDRPCELFASELSLALYRGASPYRVLHTEGDATDAGDLADRRRFGATTGVEIRDTVRQMIVRISWTAADHLVVYPIETVSLSEDGFERVLQGIAVAPVWDLSRVTLPHELLVRVTVTSASGTSAAPDAHTRVSAQPARA
jgi:alpha-amylase